MTVDPKLILRTPSDYRLALEGEHD